MPDAASPPALPTLETDRTVLRPTTEDDVDALVAVLAEPEVRTWWGPYDADRVRSEAAEVRTWTVVGAGAVRGWLHVHEETDPDWPHVSFDIALGAGGRGAGVGREVLRAAVRHFVDQGHHRFTIDPAVDNTAAIRCYSAVGFRPVGVMREYQRDPNGTAWTDALFMDLLARELVADDSSPFETTRD